MQSKRIIQVFKNNEWVNIEFKNLRKGDKFKIFNDNNETIIDNKGNTEWIALSNPKLNKDKMLFINIQGVQKQTTLKKE
jgi:ribosomal protein L21E